MTEIWNMTEKKPHIWVTIPCLHIVHKNGNLFAEVDTVMWQLKKWYDNKSNTYIEALLGGWGPSNLFIYQARESLAWSQQGFWQPSFCRKRDLWNLCFDWGNWVVLHFTAYLEERGSIKKLKGWNMDLSPLFFFLHWGNAEKLHPSSPIKKRLQKSRFLQKLSCQKPCWDQARLYLAW